MPRKPQQARAKATVAAIVDAGFLCVVEHGTEGTTTHHIARRAGVSVGTLYEYFADKHAIFDAMNDRISADVTELLASLTPELAREDVRTALRRLLDAFRELLERNDGRYLAYARHAMLSHARVHTAPIEKALLDLSVQFVMRQPTAAKLRNVPAMSYIFVNSGIFTMIRYLTDPHPPMSFDEMAEGLIDMVSHYVERELQLVAKREGSKSTDTH
jgi:AcrR family transcriptional regulator